MLPQVTEIPVIQFPEEEADLCGVLRSRLFQDLSVFVVLDKEKGELRLVYRVAGAGTKEFSALAVGDTIDVLGPLGNGFPLLEGKKAFLIGGLICA